MKESAILFSAEMVSAILHHGKTQTRRIVQPLREGGVITGAAAEPFHALESSGGGRGFNASRIECVPSPKGVPGDRLWVRETGWERPERTPKMLREGADTWERYYYDADLSELDHEEFKGWGFKRRPSIHMPRWASRLTLEITSVLVERLREITEEDAVAESCQPESDWTAAMRFALLWDSINGKKYPWSSDPWVWVVGFRRVEASA